jgi:glycosyltransferase involved in cell wall biosynthesis
MRIMQIGPIPPEIGGKSSGGVASHLWDLSQQLAYHHEIGIYADNLFIKSKFPVQQKNIPIYGFSLKTFFQNSDIAFKYLSSVYKLYQNLEKLLSPLKIIARLVTLEYAINDFRPDIIHVHLPEVRFPLIWNIIGNKVPIVSTIHSMNSIDFTNTRKSKKYYNVLHTHLDNNRNMIFVNMQLKERFLAEFYQSKTDNWVINNPIDTNKFFMIDRATACKNLGLNTSAKIILFVGNFHIVKGIYTLLEAGKELLSTTDNVKIMLIGDGPEFQGAERFIRKNNLESTIKLLGRKNYSSILNYYNCADLFVLPSVSESWGLVCFEAMGCGLPVVGTLGVPIEVIPNKKIGLRVKINNPVELAEAMKYALNLKWDKNYLINHAKSYDWSNRITEYEEVYNIVHANFINADIAK